MQTKQNQFQDRDNKVLAIDDDRSHLNYLKHILVGNSICEMVQADSAETAIRLLKGADSRLDLLPFDAILLDICMPDIDGIHACKMIKAIPFIKDIPIIMVTADGCPQTLESAFNAGASDYITKPFSKVELVVRLKSAFEKCQMNMTLKRLAFYDGLTGLANRQLLMDRMEHAQAYWKRKGARYALLYLDLDNFKPLNDQLGHDMGDFALAQVAARLKQRVREVDTVARVGGDEFVVLLSDIDGQSEVEGVTQQLITTIGHPINCNGIPWQLGVSVGIAIPSGPNLTASCALKAADNAMYRAKRSGGNCFYVQHPGG